MYLTADINNSISKRLIADGSTYMCYVDVQSTLWVQLFTKTLPANILGAHVVIQQSPTRNVAPENEWDV